MTSLRFLAAWCVRSIYWCFRRGKSSSRHTAVQFQGKEEHLAGTPELAYVGWALPVLSRPPWISIRRQSPFVRPRDACQTHSLQCWPSMVASPWRDNACLRCGSRRMSPIAVLQSRQRLSRENIFRALYHSWTDQSHRWISTGSTHVGYCRQGDAVSV